MDTKTTQYGNDTTVDIPIAQSGTVPERSTALDLDERSVFSLDPYGSGQSAFIYEKPRLKDDKTLKLHAIKRVDTAGKRIVIQDGQVYFKGEELKEGVAGSSKRQELQLVEKNKIVAIDETERFIPCEHCGKYTVKPGGPLILARLARAMSSSQSRLLPGGFTCDTCTRREDRKDT